MVATNILARENRVMINAIQKDIKAIREDGKDTRVEMTNISNHYSKRLPAWATVLFMVLTAVIGGMAGRALF